MTTAIETVSEPTALAVPSEEMGLSVEHLIARVDKIQEVQRRIMKENIHWGKVPGVEKPTLLKAGAELLMMTFRMAPDLELQEHRDGDHLEVVCKCVLFHSPTGAKLGSGVGSCSTKESKYAYRKADRTCPSCGSSALLKSKHDPEYFCWAKKGGCGATFDLDDKRITSQVVGRVPNPDLADQWNVVRKIAVKRAMVAATLLTTNASHLFTQDVEEMAGDDVPTGTPAARPSRDADLYTRIAESIAKARTPDDLTAVAKQLADVKDQRSLAPEPFKRLRAAWATKRDELEHDQGGYEDAEYEDVEDVERAAISEAS